MKLQSPKKVRHNSSQKRSSSVNNSSEYPTSSATSSSLSSWSQASSQQFSVASKQHPSLGQPGLSITKIGQGGDNDSRRKGLDSKRLNKMLSKLNPVPVSASVNQNSTQLNFPAKDLDIKAASLYAGSTSQDVSQYDQNYSGMQAQQVNGDTNQGYYDQYHLGYYQDTPTTQPYQYSNQIYPTPSYQSYPIAYGPATVTPTETSTKHAKQSAGFEDYINTEEASSIQ